MSTKDFQQGMIAGAKPFGDKLEQLAKASETAIDGIKESVTGIHSVVDTILDDLSLQDKKRIYDLNTVVNISDLDDTEKEYLCSIVYAVAKLDSDLTEGQQEYLRALKSHLKIVDVQTNINLSSIENIDNIITQKAIMQVIMEFLFLKYKNHDYMDDYTDLFDCFSVNRKGIREIQECIDSMYTTIGINGIAEHYGSTKKVTIVQNNSLSKAELDLRSTAESAYLNYDLKTAQTLFNLLSNQGDGRSCYFMSQIYANGYKHDISIDIDQTQKYIKQGAVLGDLLCLLKQAEFEQEIENFCLEYSEAIYALADQGDVFAMYELARLYDSEQSKIQDINKAEYWYSFSAKSGFWMAKIALGDLYFLKKEYDRAFLAYTEAYERGYSVVAGSLANCYANGLGIAQDSKKAYELHKEAANYGKLVSQEYMASYEQNNGNLSEALRWLDLSIKNGSTKNYYKYAKLYYAQNRFQSNKLTISGNDTYNGRQTAITEYWLVVAENLIFATVCGNERAQVELIGATLPSTWWILYKQGKLTSINNRFSVLDKEYSFSDYSSGEVFCETTRSWRIDILRKFANAGSGAAAYYVGMEYGHQYDVFKRSSDKSEAIKWLSTARRCGIQDRSIDDALKKLNAFKMFFFPYPNDFVE